MYKIGLRSGSPVSAGHMMEIKGTIANMGAKTGALACIVNGILSSAAGNCPDALVSSINGYLEGEDGPYPESATVMLLTPDMVLEAPVRGTNAQIADLKAGMFINFNDYELDAASKSAYCQVIDTLGAKKAGDKILVRFINNNKAST